MNKINPLFEAMSNIDDNIVASARKPRKRPIALIVAAAAAVSVLAFTGFVGVGDNYNVNVTYTFDDGKKLNFSLPAFDITIPKEYKDREDEGILRMYGKLPSEVFADFGLTPLTSDNFTEEIEFEPFDNVAYMECGQPDVEIRWCTIELRYLLFDKNIQRLVSIHATYCVDDEYNKHADWEGDPDTPYEILKLKDGSKCRVSPYGTVFVYEGVEYNVDLYDYPGTHDYSVPLEEVFKQQRQVIEDLSIIA